MTKSSIIILHTNDIHGRVEGLARVTTLVEKIRADNPVTPVFYFDLGDVEEPSQRLSNITKGAGMHRLLNAAGCDTAVAGNGAWMRYGPQVLVDHSAAAHYPLLLANLRTADGKPLAGVQPTCILQAGDVRLGLIGVTADTADWLGFFDLSAEPALTLIRELGAALRQDGTDAILLLSHQGLPADRELAAGLQEDVIAVIGGHTHNLLPEGEQVGQVMVAQAGQYAEHLGRLDLSWDGEHLTVTQASVILITEDTPPSPGLLAEAVVVEAECERYLAEIIGELAEPLDLAVDRECAVGNLMADMLLQRMGGEVAVVAAGHAFTGPLPAGPLSRGMLWDVCNTTANPALVAMSGAQLTELITKGLDLDFAADRPHTLRGHPRGLLHLSGATVRDGQVEIGGQPVGATVTYRVAGSDWEFEPYGGYTDASWGLHPQYEVPTILREALEDFLTAHSPIRGTPRRLG